MLQAKLALAAYEVAQLIHDNKHDAGRTNDNDEKGHAHIAFARSDFEAYNGSDLNNIFLVPTGYALARSLPKSPFKFITPDYKQPNVHIVAYSRLNDVIVLAGLTEDAVFFCVETE